MDKFEQMTSMKRTVAGMADILGAVPAPVRPTSVQDYLRKFSVDAPRDVRDGLQTAVGAGAGYWYGKKHGHKWLGAIGGASLGRNLPALFTSDKNLALANVAQTGSGIAGSMLMKRSPKIGFVAGWLLGGLLSGVLR